MNCRGWTQIWDVDVLKEGGGAHEIGDVLAEKFVIACEFPIGLAHIVDAL